MDDNASNGQPERTICRERSQQPDSLPKGMFTFCAAPMCMDFKTPNTSFVWLINRKTVLDDALF